MSAFIGLVQFNHEPLDRFYLERLTASLNRIGPNAQKSRILSGAGFGHALLCTTQHSCDSHQPLLSPEGDTMIVGDIRLDDRKCLLQRLRNKAASDFDPTHDAALVLEAWRHWGEKLTDNLTGDFSFAIWDSRKQKLFAARDHFGIRTFYFHLTKDRLIFSNALHGLLQCSDIHKELNEKAVGDYLLFRYNTESTTTSFRHIDQLGPAHRVVFNSGKMRQQRYWTVPVDEPLRFKHDEEYVEQFYVLLRQAVKDRLGYAGTSIMLSGGMDSTSVAAHARSGDTSNYDQPDLHLVTLRTSSDIDSEHALAGRLAEDFNLPYSILDLNSPQAGGETASPHWPSPELHWYKWKKMLNDTFAHMANNAPVALTGMGGDSVLIGSPGAMLRLLCAGRIAKFAHEFVGFRHMHGIRPPLGLRKHIQARAEPTRYPGVPIWINREFAQRICLPDRLTEFIRNMELTAKSEHTSRPEAYQHLTSSYWQYVLAAHDAQVTGFPLEFRHPFFDIRLVQFLMRIDSPRWFFRKAILRQAMKDELPQYITLRKKSAFNFNLRRQAQLALTPDQWDANREAVSQIDSFVDYKHYARISRNLRSLTAIEADQLSAAVNLAAWSNDISSIISH